MARGGTSKRGATSMGKGAGRKKKYGSGAIGELKKRRAARQAAGKWTLGEKLTKAGRTRAKDRKIGKQVSRAIGKGKNVGLGGTVGERARGLTSKARAKSIGARKGTKVRRGAISAKSTKGGDYVKYEKGSRAAKSFQSAFKSGCSGGAKSFTWDGRSYSCKKK